MLLCFNFSTLNFIKFRGSALMKIIRFSALIVAIILMAEAVLQFCGLMDFPIYRRSPDVGYFLSPGQSGAFLNKNKWYVDRQGLNNDREFSSRPPYSIIIGDSVVYGGNPVDYHDRIGAITSLKSARDVWVAALGGWSLYNELAFINAHRNIVLGAESLIFVFDAGDLDGLAPWGGELVHPTKKPHSALVYLFRKYMPKIIGMPSVTELPAISSETAVSASNEWRVSLDSLASNYKGRILFVLYPSMDAIKDGRLWDGQMREIKKYINSKNGRIQMLDVARSGEWDGSKYRDETHPNVGGNNIIASMIAGWISAK